MNGMILYQSKYGATKKYAQWLSEKTGFPCVETRQARLSDVRAYAAEETAGEASVKRTHTHIKNAYMQP